MRHRRWLELGFALYLAVVAFGVFGPNPGRHVIAGLDALDVANVVMFVPFGVLFPTFRPRWRRWTIPAGVALSASIELTQLVFLSWRTASLTDVCLNSFGAVLGFALWLGGRAVRRRPLAAA